MSPQTFCLWVADRCFPWWILFRRKPEQTRRLSWSVVPVATAVGAFVVAAPFTVIGGLVMGQSSGIPAGSLRAMADPALEFGAIAGFWLSMFGRLVWNQRAARIEAGTLTAPTTPAWPGLLLLGPIYWTVLGVFLPAMLFTGVENIRGALRWNSVRAEALAAGETLRVQDLLPALVAPEDNFAAIPEFAGMFEYHRTPGNPEAQKGTNFLATVKASPLPYEFLPKRATKAPKSPRETLDDWTEAFRAAREARAAGDPKAMELPEYGMAPDNANAAEVVLAALKGFDGELKHLKEASRRPQSLFPIHWDEGFEALLPHLARLKAITTILDLRAWAELERGDAAAAFDDALAAARIADAPRDEPLLISQLVRYAESAIVARTIHRGIERHAWTEAQLAELQKTVESWNPLAGLHLALRGERAEASMVFDRWAVDRRWFAQEIYDVGQSEAAESRAVDWTAYLTPTGWIRNGQVGVFRYEQSILDTVKPVVGGIPADGLKPVFDRINRLEDQMPNHPDFARPGGTIARILAPAVSKAIGKGFSAEQNARSTVVACALERHRVAKGSYPESLSALVPAYLAKDPIDVMDGKPLRYQRTSLGSFRIWSVGLDGVDNGGQAKAPRTNEPLDWAWP